MFSNFNRNNRHAYHRSMFIFSTRFSNSSSFITEINRDIYIYAPNLCPFSDLPLISKPAQICPSAVRCTYRNALLCRYRPVKAGQRWSKGIDHPEKNSKKILKNQNICGIKDTQVRKVRAMVRAVCTFQELVSEEKQ